MATTTIRGGDRAVAGLALGLGLFGLLNGAAMLGDPLGWYERVPGVPATGPFNQHFVRDIGMTFALAGAALLAGLRWRSQRAGLWSVAALWLMGHALFHLWEVAVGICGPDALMRDFAGVSLPGLLASALAAHALRRAA